MRCRQTPMGSVTTRCRPRAHPATNPGCAAVGAICHSIRASARGRLSCSASGPNLKGPDAEWEATPTFKVYRHTPRPRRPTRISRKQSRYPETAWRGQFSNISLCHSGYAHAPARGSGGAAPFATQIWGRAGDLGRRGIGGGRVGKFRPSAGDPNSATGNRAANFTYAN